MKLKNAKREARISRWLKEYSKRMLKNLNCYIFKFFQIKNRFELRHHAYSGKVSKDIAERLLELQAVISY